MAAIPVAITPTTQSGAKLNRVVTANAEDVVTVTITNSSTKQWYLQLIWTTAPGLYHTTAGQVVANGAQIATSQPFNVPVGAGSVFYTAATGAGTLDILAFSH